MSAVIIVQLTERNYAPAESQKQPEHVSHDCAAHEILMRTIL